MRSRRPVVGVDLDGVLGNQVSGVLERENARLGLNLTYEQVIHWDLPFGDTSFRPAISRAMEDPSYVLQMPVHDGAPEMLVQLKERFLVKIVTVRPVEAITWTKDWLAANALAYDELVPAKEALKSRHGADALVDDYAGNIAEFLGHSDGIAILVDQPWNQNADELAPWLDGVRLRRLASLGDVAAHLDAAIG
jgi:5'(3')-deoxyribonucleotidase